MAKKAKTTKVAGGRPGPPKRESVEAVELLSKFAATMAHEIRNPLATIFSALSQVRKHGQVVGDSATLLNIAEEEALRLNRMVAGLLEFARPRPPKLRGGRPLEAVSDAVNAFRRQECLPEDLDLAVEGGGEQLLAWLDADHIQRALQHLLDNAVHAPGPGPRRVRARVLAHEGPPQKVIVEVEDDGAGIPRDFMDRVFDPFFSSKPSGIGLGLPVVRRIAEDHGGRVEIDSVPGKGTRVRIFLEPAPGREGQEPVLKKKEKEAKEPRS
ncbi:MAG: ATP-binding protein [Deltaproteobacteria bacterium]|nr:ATP-binding protein [Deltaproteobacteria bacterium]